MTARAFRTCQIFPVGRPLTTSLVDAKGLKKPHATIVGQRLRSANPVAGPIFANSVGNPLSLDSMVNRVILPSLNRCETCGKKDSDHQKTVHRLQT